MPLLIPVLTTYGLPLGYMGDILGGGFILSLAGFLVAVAALQSGRLDAYLAYMLLALIAVLAAVTALA